MRVFVKLNNVDIWLSLFHLIWFCTRLRHDPHTKWTPLLKRDFDS